MICSIIRCSSWTMARSARCSIERRMSETVLMVIGCFRVREKGCGAAGEMHGGEGEAPAASGRGGELEGVAQGSGGRPHGPVAEDTRSRGVIAAQKEAGSAFSAPAAAGAGASGRTLRLRRGGEISPGEEAPVAAAPLRARGAGRAGLDGSG